MTNFGKIILRLNRGEEIVANLIDFCQQNEIKSAWVWGLGAVSSFSISAYDLETRSYSTKEIEGKFEIASLSGNIGSLEDKIIPHIHAVFSDQKMATVGGHLNSAIVSATCEILLEPLEYRINRKFNEEIGLNLIDLKGISSSDNTH